MGNLFRQSLKTQLTLVIALIVFLTVGLISALSNIFIGKQFEDYKVNQEEKNMEDIVVQLCAQYDKGRKTFDEGFVHAIGMSALNRGYIISVDDESKNTVWDARTCDMTACEQMMNDMSKYMIAKYPSLKGQFTDKYFPLTYNEKQIGIAKISYYGPYFLNENDFNYLSRLNAILIIIGVSSLIFSVIIGLIISKGISNPILKSIVVTKQISNGDYSQRLNENTTIKEVNDLILSVNNLAKSLESQEKLRKQLTADVAHELRTPITTLQTHVEAMTIGIWEPTQNRLESCYDEILRISKLIMDLESIANVESNILNLSKTRINVKELVQKSLINLELDINKKNLDTSVYGECSSILADENRITQVLINLLTNAIKYTNENGEIKINLENFNDFVKICIEDNGIGISEEDLPYIFERFYRADKSRNKMTGGTGIGLAVVKSIVDVHGGKVYVESKLNEGSLFTVLLPIN